MNQPPQIWQPAIPLRDLEPRAVNKAHSLRRALARALQMRRNPTAAPAEIECAALEDFRREFEREVTVRTIRALIKRTLDRDNGADNLNRLEIYLDGNAKRVARPESNLPFYEEHFRELCDVLATFKDPSNPSPREIEHLWERVFDTFRSHTAAGADERSTRTAIVNFLFRSCPWLSRSKHALSTVFAQRLNKPSQRDGRHARKGIPTKPPISEEMSNALAYHSATNHGGRLAPALRDFADVLGVDDELAQELMTAQGVADSELKSKILPLNRQLTASINRRETSPAQSPGGQGETATQKDASRIELFEEAEL